MKSDRLEIIRAINTLFCPGDVWEVRCLEASTPKYLRAHNESGFFNDANAAADAVATMQAVGIYVTINGVIGDLLARAENRLKVGGRDVSANDTHVQRRRWMLVDVDSVRPAGISSTNAEKEVSLQRARNAFAWLQSCGWPEAVVADSGNGYHLLYRIDEPAADERLVESCLKALATLFDDERAKIDTGVFNPSRIVRLYGTMACKGDSTTDRPHRLSKIVYQPEDLIAVPHGKLLELASLAPKPESKPRTTYSGQPSDFDIRQWVGTHLGGLVGEELPWNGSGWKRQFKVCPWNSEHVGTDAFIGQISGDGAIVAKCSHNSCQWGWHELRERYEPKAERTYRPAPPAARAVQPAAVPARTTTMREATEKYLTVLRSDEVDLIETGIPELDYAIGGGLDRGEMVVLCARPSHGKTAVALQFLHAATAMGMPALMISEEMSALALGKRTLQFASSIPQEHWRTSVGHLEDELTGHFKQRAEFYIAESAGTAERACDIIGEHVVKHGVSIVAVDYAQLLKSSGNGRYEQTTATSMALRKITNDTRVVLLVLAQLSRAVEGRDKFIPKMSDIKDTGQFEQDADCIVASCWPHRLNSSHDPKEYIFYVMKNRNRPINASAVKCRFNPSRQTILPPPIEDHSNYRSEFSAFNKGAEF